jgi:hypothetical protein
MEDVMLSGIARQLLSIQSKGAFTRTVKVLDGCRGDVEVSISYVYINPHFFTRGDPLAVTSHILKVCAEYDRKRARATRIAITNLQDKLRYTLRQLQQVAPESIQQIIEEELGREDESNT